MWNIFVNLGVSEALPPEGGAAEQIATKFSIYFQ